MNEIKAPGLLGVLQGRSRASVIGASFVVLAKRA